jgi:methionyl-tRNA synthetase
MCGSMSEEEKKKEISYNDFLKMDIRIGLVVEAESIPKSRNLIKLMVDLGEEEPRQILAGLAGYYEPEKLMNKKVVVLANLKPRKMMGLMSNGMILAADVDDAPILLQVESEKFEDVPPGSSVL